MAYTRDSVDPAKAGDLHVQRRSRLVIRLAAYGCVRPKKVERTPEGMGLPPPGRLVDNEDSILDVTDLVFIDPVTTGFSRAIPFKDANKFHGVDSDIESVGEFIRLWMTRYGRWSSPKFLAGESYGTTRAAGLSGWLESQGVYPNGIILISSILNFETSSFESGNDLAYQLFLPTYTAIGWYHKKPSPDLQNGTVRMLSRRPKYALGPYSPLMQGDRISDEEAKNVAAHLANLTGLPQDYIERSNLRIRIDRSTKN
jgi:carboxypeptidase C (cathepsin A)